MMESVNLRRISSLMKMAMNGLLKVSGLMESLTAFAFLRMSGIAV
jgi:hypothetical protein